MNTRAASDHAEANSSALLGAPRRAGADWPFFAVFILLAAFYLFMVLALVGAKVGFLIFSAGVEGQPGALARFQAIFASPEIRFATKLSLISCSATAVLSLITAVPIGYLMARFRFRGKAFVDGMLDVPIVLPPLVLGLGLLILFQTRIWGGRTVEDWIEAAGKALLPIRLFGHEFLDIRLGVTYRVPAVILAQYMVSCAFAVRTMRSTFEQISPRQEEVAMTLGGSRRQAFFGVTLPRARTGLLAAFTLAWARALGEFGPILIFAGATRRKTEVLSTTVFLEMSAGNVENAVAVSLLMVAAAALALTVIRVFGHRSALE